MSFILGFAIYLVGLLFVWAFIFGAAVLRDASEDQDDDELSP